MRTVDMGDFPLRGGVAPIDGVDEAYAPRRTVLDKLLVDAAVEADVERYFWQTIDLVPNLSARVRQGTRVEPFTGMGDLPSFFRRPYGRGWALVGDAGYHKDPYLERGIGDAFRDAELLAAAIDQGLSGRFPLQAALAQYEGRRNAAAMPIYELNCWLAALQPLTPEQRQLRAVLRHNPEDTRQFFGVTGGTVPVHGFFAPENVGRIIAAARSRTASPVLA